MSSNRQDLFLNYIINRKQKHKFHMVSPSPWPLFTAISAFLLVIGLVSWMHKIDFILVLIGIMSIILSMYFWFRDIIREAVYMGYHTQKVQLNLRFGFTLFIISEVMFFFGFFWSLLHFSLCPSIFTGNIWPPEGIVNFILSHNVSFDLSWDKISEGVNKYFYNFFLNDSYNFEFVTGFYYFPLDNNYFENFIDNLIELDENENNFVMENRLFFSRYEFYNEFSYFKREVSNYETTLHINLFSPGVLVNPLSIPLLNTVILLSSGVFLTYSHICLKIQKFLRSIIALGFTIIFGIYFFLCQIYEYSHSGFSINDGVYGSTFYMLTGFHGFHVFVGTVFLIVCFFRFLLQHFTPMHHFGFEAAIWYWHFVDVVWILLFFLVYYWPNIFYFKSSSYIFNFDSNTVCINKSFLDLINYKEFDFNKMIQFNGNLKNIKKFISLVLIDSHDKYFEIFNKKYSYKLPYNESLFSFINLKDYLKIIKK